MEQAKATYKVVRARATAPGSCNGFRKVGEEFDVRVKLDARGQPVKGSWFDIVPDAGVVPLVEPSTENTLGSGAKALGMGSPNVASTGREKITLAKGGAAAAADLV